MSNDFQLILSNTFMKGCVCVCTLHAVFYTTFFFNFDKCRSCVAYDANMNTKILTVVDRVNIAIGCVRGFDYFIRWGLVSRWLKE